MDQLEKYITDHRAAFDDQSPPKHIWQQLDGQLHPREKKSFRLWRGFRIAAAVLLLIGLGTLLGIYVANRNFAAEAIANKLPTDFEELENYYQQQINTKRQQLVSFSQEDQGIETDMQQLDQALQELKQDILSAPKGTEEQIINAMIRNYQTKIDLLETVLERMQQHLHENEQLNQTNNEATDI